MYEKVLLGSMLFKTIKNYDFKEKEKILDQRGGIKYGNTSSREKEESF